MIGEKTIRTLIQKGFPCLAIGNRRYINIDTFNDDLSHFSKSEINTRKLDMVTIKRKVQPRQQNNYHYNNGSIRRIVV